MPHVAAAAQQAISASLLTWPARKANIGRSVTISAASQPACGPPAARPARQTKSTVPTEIAAASSRASRCGQNWR